MSTPVSENSAETYRSRQVPGPELVADGVWAVPVPLHGSPLRSIIVHLVETSEGPVLVDAGYEHPTCWESFLGSLEVVGHRVEDVQGVLITHNHPDHVGFADRVREASGAPVTMHRLDDFGHVHETRGRFLEQLSRALAMTGAPPDVVAVMESEAARVAHHAESLRLDVVLTEDTDLRFGDVTVRAVHTPGHTYGHTVYVARGAVFTGDTMMAEGPTQLAIPSLAGDDPAGQLLATLDLVGDLDVAIACPAHQYAYRDVAGRAAELRAFHAAEVEAVRALATQHATAWDIAPHLSWSKPWDHLGSGSRRFALVHTLALLQSART